MSEPEHLSKTPILDLEQPLPLPPRQRRSSATLAALTVIAVFGLRSLIPVVIVLAYFFISLAVVAIHEFGHWLAGRSVGLRLTYLVIGPVKLIRECGHWRIYRRSQFTGGFILMSLDKYGGYGGA
jgi:hypothetical protein